jgi:hypothetical protein
MGSKGRRPEMAEGDGEVSEKTRTEEELEAGVDHVAGRGPTPQEERDADEVSLDDGVEENYRDMTRRGVEERGEGRID